MSNRWTVGILVILVVLTAGIGYYSFTLNRQVDTLNRQLASFRDEQTARVQTIGDDLASLRSQTESGLSSLETKAAAAQADIDAMKSDLVAARADITRAQDNITGVSSQVTGLDRRVAGAETALSGLSDSLIDAASVYRQAVQATVRITDGQIMSGSGFIYDSSGRVVTAYHVVNGLSSIYVIMYDGRISRASVIGFCPFSDVAVLKLDVNPSLDPLPLADSSLITIGEPVVAIGSPGDSDNPLGLRDTLTAGIISQVNRFIDVENQYIANLIQFDTPINFGNSGCPLIDARGKVVGVVNARISPSQGDGIGWAIASNKVKRVVDSIIATGSFPYPWIGTGIADLTPEQVNDKGLENADGILIGIITAGSPAQAAGLHSEDIIISMDGIPMRNTADLTCYLGEFKSPGDTTVIELIRGSSRLTLSVTVGTRPE
jgi:S1-C subfamily serine protease